MDTITTIFSIVILIISVIVHEISHGYTAYALGDPTAKYAGRLTINPLKHIDLFGSIILPALTVFSGLGFVIGWAKPVPYNPYNLRNQKWGDFLVSAAGPFSNIVIAVVAGITLRIMMSAGLASVALVSILTLIAYINIVLAVFNLIPIPPLDGSKMAMFFLPYEWKARIAQYEHYFFIALILFILAGWQFVYPFVRAVASLITGVSL